MKHSGFWIHPAVLDAATQALLTMPFIRGMLVPQKTGQVHRLPTHKVPREFWVHVECTRSSPEVEESNYMLIDPADGTVFLTMTKCIGKKKNATEETFAPPTWGIRWAPKELTLRFRADMTDVDAEVVDGRDLPVIYRHKKGGELELVEIVKTLPANAHRNLWIVTPFNSEGAKAAGMARTLMNEHMNWSVYCLHVDPGMSDSYIDGWLKKLENAQEHVLEPEMRISNGRLYVPRVDKIDENFKSLAALDLSLTSS